MADPRSELAAALADRYALERELGRGGMATVYLARDLRHDRPVALKVLHPELAAALGPERFQREIRLAARLQHPHILTVLDSGEAGSREAGGSRLWFTMPFVGQRATGVAEPGSASAVTTATTTASSPPSAQKDRTRHRRHVPLALALAFGFILGLGVLFGWLRSHGNVAETGSGTTKLLAVLPFENLGDSTDEYFAEGITDEVRGKLATLPGLQVIASGSAGQYKHSTKSPQQIAQELGVQYLLTGKIRWEQGGGGQSRVRVSPELVEVARGSAPTTRWQQLFDASLTDVFQVLADIAGRVAQALNVALGTGVQQQLAEKPTADLAAYDAYLKGVEFYGLDNAPATLRKALSHFEQAVALDTSFAPAWARLSQAASLLAVVGVPSPTLAAQSRAAAQLGQGYHFWPALSATAIEELLAAGRFPHLRLVEDSA